MACAPSEDSDQPGHPPSLIRAFLVSMKKAWVLSYTLSAQRRLWWDWADLSLRLAHSHFVGFVTRWLILFCRFICIALKTFEPSSCCMFCLSLTFCWLYLGQPGDHLLGKSCPLSFQLVLFYTLSRAMRKCVLCHMRTTKAQISLRIRFFMTRLTLYLVFVFLSRLVSWAECGSRLYRFLIITLPFPLLCIFLLIFSSGVKRLYTMSYIWYTPIRCLTCVVVGLIVSLVIGELTWNIQLRTGNNFFILENLSL